jgi:Ca2+-binding EF-hand superfamily protein
MYSKVDVTSTHGADEPTDEMGFYGRTTHYREKITKNLTPIDQSEFVKVFAKNNKLPDVMLVIKQIDRDHNGYITRNEMDDILKMTYREEFLDKNLYSIINKFGSL